MHWLCLRLKLDLSRLFQVRAKFKNIQGSCESWFNSFKDTAMSFLHNINNLRPLFPLFFYNSCLLHRLTINSDSWNHDSFESIKLTASMVCLTCLFPPVKTMSLRIILLRLCSSSLSCILSWLLISYLQFFGRAWKSQHLQATLWITHS